MSPHKSTDAEERDDTMNVCRQCGFENEEGTTFCGNCGEFLGWEQPTGDNGQPVSSGTPTTDPATSVEPGNLLQQAKAGLQPDERKPEERKPGPDVKPATTAVKARTVDVGVTASPPEVFVEPGAEASCEVRVLNSGSIVDQVQLKVTGAGASWASFQPDTLNVYPGATGTATLTFRPPRTSQTTAGVVPFEVTGISQEDPSVTDRDSVNVTVGAFHDLAGALHPNRSRGRRSTRHELTLTNRGNARISVALAGSDESEALALGIQPPATTRSVWTRAVAWMLGRNPTPPQASVDVDPGQAVNVDVSVVAHKMLLTGTPVDHPFKVAGSSEGNQTVSLDATMVQAALLPSLIPRLLMALLPLLAGVLIFLALTATVPNVAGQAETAAVANLQKVGFKPTRLEEKSDKVAVGKVTRTDPGGGSLRRKHTGVTFWVSLGFEQVSVPSLANIDAPTAKLQLEQAHLVEQVVNEANDTVAAGKVVETAPAANTLVDRGTTVTVHVSLGSSPVVVPNVAGSTQATAAGKLRAAGFQVAALQEASAGVRAGNVIRTDPPGGEQAAKASPVNMFVSTGPAPGGAPAPGPGAPAPGPGVPPPGPGVPAPAPTQSAVRPGLAFSKITAFPVPTAASMRGITTGSDGNLWFIDGDNIDRMTSQGLVNHFPVAPLGGAIDITGGPDGNLWFTATSTIGRITTAGVITPFPTSSVTNTAITVGPDSNLWFLAPVNNKIGRISTTGAVTLFDGKPNMRNIASGPDGKVWFTWADANDQVGRISTGGTLAADSVTPPGGASDIALASDGSMWITQPNGNGVAKITPSGAVSNVPVPTANAVPGSIVAGPDGNLWITETKAGNVARVTTSGEVTEFKFNRPGSSPTAITVGPDSTLWFVDNGSHELGRVTFS